MSYRARVYIQGVGAYVPHADANQLLFLMPDQSRAEEWGIRDFQGQSFCYHYAVVQFHSRHLDPSLPPCWMSMDISGYWIGVETDSTVRLDLAEHPLVAVPQMEEFLGLINLEQFAKLNSAALPGPSFDKQLVRAGLYLDKGRISPHPDFEGPMVIMDGEEIIKKNRRFSSTMIVDYGDVSSFRLQFRSFDSETMRTVNFPDNRDIVELWIRHFCQIDPPKPSLPDEASDAFEEVPDLDFALNYAMASDVQALKQARGNKLPYPQGAEVFAGGVPISDPTRKCTSAEFSPLSFPNPL